MVIQDHLHKPIHYEASSSHPSVPQVRHVTPEGIAVISESFSSDDIPVIEERDLTDISLLRNFILAKILEETMPMKLILSKCVLD